MQKDVFPSEYSRMIDEGINKEVYEARQRSNSRIQAIDSLRASTPKENGSMWGTMIGIYGGFAACSCVCISNNSVGAGFATWVVIGIICAVIGFAIDKSAKNNYENNQVNADYRIREEESSIEKEIQKIQSDAQKRKNQYLTEFEINAQNLSAQFTESEPAKEIIEWMTNRFCKNIDAADRRNHIEKITVPFVFNVCKDKIICDFGHSDYEHFDFELKRCRNLNSPLEQTALARAIASAIQMNIIMKYPEDSTGTDISVEISYSYSDYYPRTTVTYVAPNGNYKAVRGW
jgi:hypothetical protein